MSEIKAKKLRVAVFFGGRSPEHDVSIITGLQVMKAIDLTRYEPFPVYVSPAGRWYVGDVLRSNDSYMLSEKQKKVLTEVTLDLNHGRIGRLLPVRQPFFGTAKPVEFDVALPAFHGIYGEDGVLCGALEMAGVPYAGMRHMGSAIAMDKWMTKRLLKSLDIPVLPSSLIKRPDEGFYVPEEELKGALKGFKFPCVVKPNHLGSSIGAAKVSDFEELTACLIPIFELDDCAILEPFVENLVEYNAAFASMDGKTVMSVVERPKNHEELLDFKQKYQSGDGKGGKKGIGRVSEGLLSMTRELDPKMPKGHREKIVTWGSELFEALGGTGAPRIDFIGNEKTSELWVNEINPFPGSSGYFLWEALAGTVLFSELMSHLIEEAIVQNRRKILPSDPVPVSARLFSR